MRKSRFTEEQIITTPQEHDSGADVAELLRRHNISGETFYRWNRKFGGLTPAEFVLSLSPRVEPDQPRLSA